MRQLAAIGGGLSLSPQQVSALPERLRAADASRQQRTEPKTVWDRPWVLALLAGLLGLEWWLRRRSGLV
jgi:hypothetical protein